MQNIPGNSSFIESKNRYQRKRFRTRDLDEKTRFVYENIRTK